MTTWSHGYVADSAYTLSYHQAATPAHIGQVCAISGVDWRPGPRMAVLDIGCGRGLTVNTLAAANPEWTVLGLDYNPAHIVEAQELADAAGLGNSGFVEADLAALTDAEIDRLPELDLVMVHGVWSWVADPVRAGILRVLSRRLKPGGVCYMGYNAQPGFGADAALQRLFRHLAALETRGNSTERAAAVLPTIRALAETNPTGLGKSLMLDRLTGPEAPPNAAYLAHEFLTAHWRPEFHEDLCAALSVAKLEYVGSATLHENMPDMLFSPEQRAVYDRLPDGPPREFMKDICMKRPFRRDVFIRGLRRVEPLAALEQLVVAARRPLPELSPKLPVPVGVAEFDPALWQPVAAALAEGSQSLGRLCRLNSGRNPNAAELLALLDAAGLVLPVLRQGGPTEVSQRFHRALFEVTLRTGATDGQLALASGMTAGGMSCAWLELAVLVQPDAFGPLGVGAAALAQRLLPRLDEAGRAEAEALIERVLVERPPIWRRFGILPA